jgi:hypothetical protein
MVRWPGTGVGWCSLVVGSSIGLFLTRVVIHDALVWRAEFNPTTAWFKAVFSAPQRISACHEFKLVSRGDPTCRPTTEDLGGGLYSAVFWIDCLDESGGSKRRPVRCTMECRGLEDWELVNVKVGDEAVVECRQEIPPTREVDGLWW